MMDIPICPWIAKIAYNLAYNPDFLKSSLPDSASLSVKGM